MSAATGRARPAPNEFREACVSAGMSKDHHDGLGALRAAHRRSIEPRNPRYLSGSVDIDRAHFASEPNESRWDYGIGYRLDEQEVAIWVEFHPASSGREVSAMLAKLAWLRRKLRCYVALGRMTERAARGGYAPFRWLAPEGDIAVKRDSRQFARMASAGLAMPVRRIRLP